MMTTDMTREMQATVRSRMVGHLTVSEDHAGRPLREGKLVVAWTMVRAEAIIARTMSEHEKLVMRRAILAIRTRTLMR